MNINSIIIYLGLITITIYSIQTKSLGALAGTITGLLIIYFLLANNEQKQNIKYNLTFTNRRNQE